MVMSRPDSLQKTKQYGSFGGSREREFLRYLPLYNLQPCVSAQGDEEIKPSNFVPQPSSDAVLTAFAQLGTLRLDCKHALISLFGPNEQHVLAEATRTLSLQKNAGHTNTDDMLWVGSCTMPYDRSFCKVVLNSAQSIIDGKPQVHVIPDLAQDDTFAGHQDIVGYPNFRFLACSPIISPKGYVIGAYTILDDKPHGPLSAALEDFLTGISNTVMDYLIATRSQYQRTRSERMLVGLGSFLEGKGSLRNTWIASHDDVLSPDPEHFEGHVHREQQEMQILDNESHKKPGDSPQDELPFRLQASSGLKNAAHLKQEQRMEESRSGMRDYFSDQPRRKYLHRAARQPNAKSSESTSPKIDYEVQVQGAFSRAANIIRESIGVEAAVFFDANFASQDALLNPSRPLSESSSVGTSSSDEETKMKSFFARRELSRVAETEYAGVKTVNPCRILGFATSDTSSISKESIGDANISISEKFLSHLLRQYPRGKIFNYGQDGSISSDDSSDSVFKQFDLRPRGSQYKRKSKEILRQDAATLLQLAPDARSIVFSPLWDSHKERWYSGCLCWTKTAHRAFTSDDDLAFLFAMGNSIMEEVHRLGALLAEKAKSNLLAGISHELRSPLHGIFGTIDILNDTAMNMLQRGFMHTISSCAFTLLGTIGQLLDYASINDIRPNLARDPHMSKTVGSQTSRRGSTDEDTIVQLDAAIEDAIETVFAGHDFFRKRISPSVDAIEVELDIHTRVRIILDIKSAQNLRFLTRPGTWHVIVTNIFGNAMKFTKNGYICVSLRASPLTATPDGQTICSRITLSVKDSGCGMGEDFLANKVFSAFAQEDTLSIGNGLGLNIVHRIVSSLDGDIQITSQKGIGTEVTTTFNLDNAPYTPPSPNLSPSLRNKAKFPDHTRDLMSGKTVGILLPGTSDSEAALGLSLKKLCEEWFWMKVEFIKSMDTKPKNCDILISLHESLDVGNHEILASVSTPIERYSSPVIIICSSPSTAYTMFLASEERKYTGILEFISQPCGPRKMAKALETCIQRQQEKKNEHNHFERSFGEALCVDDVKPQIGGEATPVAKLTNIEPMRDDCDYFASKAVEPSVATTPGYPLLMEQLAPPDEDSGLENHAYKPLINQQASVLLVDDNEINVRILVAFMDKLKVNYLVARNGQEALDSFLENASHIRIILMDISMPVMDGLEATQRIREHEKTLKPKGRVRIVALTGVAQADVERDAIGSGMDEFLTKPVRLDILRPMIHRSLHDAHT